MKRIALAPTPIVVLASLFCLASPASEAFGNTPAQRTPRPYDAPLSTEGAESIDVEHGDHVKPAPELTPEYASMEEQGIKVVFHLRSRDRASSILARAVSARAELSRRLGRDVLATVEIRLAVTPLQLPSLSPPELPRDCTTVAFSAQHLAVLTLGSPAEEDPSAAYERTRHALAHLALDELAPNGKVPAWFHEGFAVDFSGADVTSRAETLAVAALGNRLLDTHELTYAGRSPDAPAGSSHGGLERAESAELARYLQASEPQWRQLVAELAHGQDFDRALVATQGADLEHLDPPFRRDLARRFAFVPVLGVATLLWMIALAWVMRKRRGEGKTREEPAGVSPTLGGETLGRRLPGVFRVPTSRTSGSMGWTDDGLPTSSESTELTEETVSALEEDVPRGVALDADVPKVEHDGRWYTLH